ncbi:MAG: MerC domain-containing protein [Saprospiraceae bacterium]
MRFITTYLDWLGFSASFLCAIHCLAVPFVMTFGLAGGMAWLENPWLEGGFFVSTFIMAGWSLYGSYPLHRKLMPAILAVTGFVVILGVHLLEEHLSHGYAAIGGAAIAYAHYLNWRYAQVCPATIRQSVAK